MQEGRVTPDLSAASLPEALAEGWGRRSRSLPPEPEAPVVAPPARGEVMLVGLSADEHLHAVERELGARGVCVARIDVDGPCSAAWQGYAPVSDGWEYGSVLCRAVDADRPLAHHGERVAWAAPAWGGPGAPARAFAVGEARMALLGFLGGVSARTWANDPWASARAEVKAVQLRAAAAAGLRVPRTLVSDDPAAIAGFAASVPRTVYKSLADPLVWEDRDRAGFLYTTELTPAVLDGLKTRPRVPGIFQERLTAVAEHRVTVVGDELFVARMASSGTALDWRRRLIDGVAFETATLDEDVAVAVRRTVAGLGLRFAAIDLVETEDGIWFLEANPSGAYGWLERMLAIPITPAICDLLLHDGS